MTSSQPLQHEADDLVATALAGMPPGWLLLRHPGSADGTALSPWVSYTLLHREVGIALIDVAPSVTPGAGTKLGRLLTQAGFPASFGGLPPIVHRTLPLRDLRWLRATLDGAFATEAPLLLRGGGHWVAKAQGLLASEFALRSMAGRARRTIEPPSPLAPSPAADAALTPPSPLPAPRPGSMTTLRWFWAGLIVALGAGAGVLQYLGPPGQVARQAAAPLAAAPPAVVASPGPLALVVPDPASALPNASPVLPDPGLAQDDALADPAPATLPGPRADVAPAPSPPVADPAPPATAPTPHPAIAAQEPDPGPATASAPDPVPSPAVAAIPPTTAAPPLDDLPLALTSLTPAPAQPAPPLAPVIATPPEPAIAHVSPALAEALVRRGEEMLSLGDISAARLLFGRAALAGLGAAMTGLGRSYDPAFLGSIGARTDLADEGLAAEWYRRAAAASREARPRTQSGVAEAQGR